MTALQRAVHVAKVRGRDTLSVMDVGDFLREVGVKFETHAADLQGPPDIVIRPLKIAIFVRGCFGHQRDCRRLKPKPNVVYWTKRFSTSVTRDRRAEQVLRADGWRVLAVWECKARSRDLKKKLLRMVAPNKTICHDCSRVVHDGKRFCTGCMDRMVLLRTNPGLPRLQYKTRAQPRRITSDRRRWVKLGLCGKCGMPALPGRRTCPAHAKPSRMRSSKRIHALADQGLCRCKAPLEPGHKRCKKCLRQLRRAARKRYQRYKTEGRCQFCPRKRLKNKTWCRKHHARVLALQPKYTAAFVARRVAAGRCVVCGRKTKGTRACKKCNQRTANRWHERVAKKQCGACGRKATPGFKTCAHCRSRNARSSRRHPQKRPTT